MGAMESPLRTLRRELARALVENQRKAETAVSQSVLFEEAPFYLDAARFAEEEQAFFRAMPLVACLSAELPQPGSYRTFDDAGVPILLTRGKDGYVRAFLNVCPHRASRIVRDESGKASRFTCRFHGWTFDATGKAIGIPDEPQFCGEIEGQKHLIAVPRRGTLRSGLRRPDTRYSAGPRGTSGRPDPRPCRDRARHG